MTTSTPEKADGLKALENAIERIRETITKLGGVFTVNMAVSILRLISISLSISLVASLQISLTSISFVWTAQSGYSHG